MFFVVMSAGGEVWAVALSRPLRRGGGAFGGNFLVAATAAAAAVVAAATALVEVIEDALLIDDALRLLSTTLNGTPCLCFGTSGSGFFDLLLPLPIDFVELIPPPPPALPPPLVPMLLTLPPPPAAVAVVVLDEDEHTLSRSQSVVHPSLSRLLLPVFDRLLLLMLLLSLSGLLVVGLPNFDEAVLEIDKLLALELGR